MLIALSMIFVGIKRRSQRDSDLFEPFAGVTPGARVVFLRLARRAAAETT